MNPSKAESRSDGAVICEMMAPAQLSDEKLRDLHLQKLPKR